MIVAEPLGMLEAGWKKTRYFSYPHAENGPAADLVAGDTRIDIEGSAASVRV